MPASPCSRRPVQQRNRAWCSLREKQTLQRMGSHSTVSAKRMSPFERTKPFAVYVPCDDSFEVRALTKLELAVCKAPGDRTVRGKADHAGRHRCRGTRQGISTVATSTTSWRRPLRPRACWSWKCITDEGNTSSYPSHKHDSDNMPDESYLEETYYHRIDPPQGFAFQRVYTG